MLGEGMILFCSGRLRTLITIATYSSHRRIIEKVEKDNFGCLVSLDMIDFFIDNLY